MFWIVAFIIFIVIIFSIMSAYPDNSRKNDTYSYDDFEEDIRCPYCGSTNYETYHKSNRGSTVDHRHCYSCASDF